VEMEPGARIAVSPEHAERAAYVAEGGIVVGDRALAVGDLAVLAAGHDVGIVAGADGAKVMLCGGAAIDGPRHIWWNFVASTRERIEEAKADWKNGRFATVPGDPEFIPLPER
jgi:redox-sensitive bicupin YhaK (pirin superfamily)